VSTAPTILVVDDDPDLRETLIDVLEEAGYRTLAAEHGQAALERLRCARDPPALILLDLMMPVMNGLAFAGEVRRDPRLAGIPIVIFSAHSDHERVAAAVRAVASLAKPLGLVELLSVVGTVVRRSSAPSSPPEPPDG